jgi:methionyl-tRNA formyltransferase
MTALKLVMMGTGEFALPAFEALYGTPHRVTGLFTQPDRQGEGHHRPPQNPLRQLALERETPIFQPAKVNTPEALADLRSCQADLVVVAAYGQILSEELLQIPRLGTINVHASLLPKYRGAAPVAYAILNGDAETGVSIIQVLPQLDAGPILAVARTPIGPRETAGALEERLARLSVDLLSGVIEQFASATLRPLGQTESLVTRAPKLKKQMGAIDWTRSAVHIDRHIRAMQPWPNPFTFLHSPGKKPQRLLIVAARPSEETPPPGPPGAIVDAGTDRLLVHTGDGVLEVLQIQPEGKRAMSAADFRRGRRISADDRFGPEVP